MSGKVSISGLVSNLDTDSIVSALVSAYSVKKDKYVKERTKLEWKQDAWKELNTKIFNFYKNNLSNMRFSTAFSVKKAESSSTKATVKADSSAVSGTQKLKIKQTATSGYLTGAVVKKVTDDGNKVAGDTKLSELGVTDGSSISVTVNGEEKNFTINGSNTVNELVVQLKQAGLDASFDANNQRFFISSKVSGEKGDFSLTSNNTAGEELLKKLGINSVTAGDMKNYRDKAAMTDSELAAIVETEYTKRKTALHDITDTAAMNKIKDALESARKKATDVNEALTKQNTLIDAKLEAVSDVSGLTFSEKSDLLEVITGQIETLGAIENRTDAQNEELEKLQAKRQVYLDATNDTFDETTYAEELNLQKTENNDIIAANTQTINTADAALADDDGFEAYINAENTKITTSNNELKASLTDFYENQRSNAQAYVAKYGAAFDLVNDPDADKTSQAYKDAAALLGMNEVGGTGSVRITGQDAEIELNGATFISNTNNFQVNGLTITANAVTEEGEEISITTETDVQSIYNKIKDFFKEYNELIKEMDTLYNAASIKGYEPLTDDEKEAMTDKEVEKWEQKIKDSILRRDDTLRSVADAMKNAFQKSFEINGKKYSLSSFGIKTAGYFTAGANEKSMFHIDGDAEDGLAGQTDKLMAAIASDPETVCSFFNQLAQGVYDTLYDKMRSTTLSSVNTVYNDKKMENDYREYTKTIKKWEEKIEAYEEKYRKQFTAMETALAKLNSNSSALAGLLGS
ncbi:MAG: flagellar filament capping protein FliD [Lachnospiraceae bacterium]|nr:flagellar filament capping protein FliD [Lachnospiraceae bacterium]